jgi:hypothetical protein
MGEMQIAGPAAGALGVWLLTIAPAVAAAQQPANVAGTWDVHIRHFTGRIVNEQWVVQQNGRTVTGKVAVSSREYPLDGTVDGKKITFTVTVRAAQTGDRDPGSYNTFLGMVEGDWIMGEIKKLNDDGTFAAKRKGPSH